MPVFGDYGRPKTAYAGSLLLVPYHQVPRGWSACKGQILPMGPNMALYALLRNTFGGDGKTTFALPNLTGAKEVTDANGHPLHWIICIVGVFPGGNADPEVKSVLGSLLLIPHDRVPEGWLACRGQILQRSEIPEDRMTYAGERKYDGLFWQFGNTYGGDGETTIALPDLTGVPTATDVNGHALTWIICAEGTALDLSNFYPFLGSLLLVAADTRLHERMVAKGDDSWLPCQGQFLKIDEHILPRLIGNTYGGDGMTTFAVPNLTGAKASTDANGHALIWFMSTVEAHWTMPYDDHGSLDRPVGAPQKKVEEE